MSRPPPFRHARILTAAPVLLGLLLGCERTEAPRATQAVPAGAFAVVGARALELELLRRIAGTSEPNAVSQRLIADARVALEATRLHPDRAVVIERGALTRSLLDALRRETLAKAPPQPAELEQARQALWAEIDRPRSVRTANVMAEVAPLSDGQTEQRVMIRIADAVQGAPNPEELNRRVEGVDKEGVNVFVLVVPPVTEDGRVYQETPADAGVPTPPVEYAQAAARLTHVGETSGLVTTSVGYHVLMALDIVPPLVLGEEEQRARVVQAVADRRVEVELDRLRVELARGVEVWRSPHQTALTSLVWRTSGP